MRILIILISFLLLAACLSEKAQLNRAELHPILKQLNLTASEPLTIKHKEVLAIEEADSKSYQPLLGVTVFIETSSPTRDEGMSPGIGYESKITQQRRQPINVRPNITQLGHTIGWRRLIPMRTA